MPLGHRRAKRRQVGLFEIVRARINIESMAQRLGPRVHSEMFARRNRAQMIQIVALHAADKRYSHAPGQERVLAVSLLTASPPRVAKDIDVGRPERQAIKDAVIRFRAAPGCTWRAPRRNHVAHAVHNRRIPRCRHADRLRKHRRLSRARHAMQRLIPCLVIGYAQPRNRRSLVFELVCLFIKVMRPTRSWARSWRKLGVKISRFLCEPERSRNQKNENCRKPVP